MTRPTALLAGPRPELWRCPPTPTHSQIPVGRVTLWVLSSRRTCPNRSPVPSLTVWSTSLYSKVFNPQPRSFLNLNKPYLWRPIACKTIRMMSIRRIDGRPLEQWLCTHIDLQNQLLRARRRRFQRRRWCQDSSALRWIPCLQNASLQTDHELRSKLLCRHRALRPVRSKKIHHKNLKRQ